ncbi:MAG TPA: peptide deformylase [Pseudomonadota bacterium]|jgi:peptide deformylase|nr:peptide deformylase [Pseudomonadota bacterium]HNI58907.1 peptide deformylase [Pseudomonadota bacterium]HNK44604.1 peptide deformylase [Pseudomonadota bacterium]HNN51796.1 peptide deformylase [Pseudomonadota bacterium]
MSLLKIVRFPSPFLRQPTQEVKTIDKEIRTLVSDMMETMCDVNGAGLAAIQVGSLHRIFIIEALAAGGERTDPPKVFINPVIEQLSPDTDVRDEGCLSFPGIFISVKRSLKAKVSALDLDGKPFSVDAEEFFARAIQHEYDHLVNKLLYDHAGPIKKQMIKRKLDKMTDDEAMDLLRQYGE